MRKERAAWRRTDAQRQTAGALNPTQIGTYRSAEASEAHVKWSGRVLWKSTLGGSCVERMSLARDILGVSKSPNDHGHTGSRASAKSRPTETRLPKPDRVSREVYLLTGGDTPVSLMPTVSPAVLREKPTQRRAWARRQFTNSARKDGMPLSHWARLSEPEGDYPFSRFNKPVRIITYTDAEYAAVLETLIPLGPTKPLKTWTASAPPPANPRQAGNDENTGNLKAASEKEAGVVADKQDSVAEITGRGSTAELVSAESTLAAQVGVQGSATVIPGATHKLEDNSAQSKAANVPQQETGIVTDTAVETVRAGERNGPRNGDQTGTDGGTADPALEKDATRKATSGDSRKKNSNTVAYSTENATASPVPKKAMHYVPPQKLWTRQETDTLFQLCADFDLRFTVIHDRWPDSLSPRSVDELKDRYYSVAKAVIEYRGKEGKNHMSKVPLALQKHAQAISMNPFDYEYECIRKNQLERQYKRSKEELREEEETVRNARRIEAHQKRLKKERERLAKLLTPAGDILMEGPDGKKVVDAKVAAVAAAAAQPQRLFPHRKSVTGAFARSSLIYTPVTQSSRLAKRIDQVLDELKVGIRPSPTRHVVDNFDLLRMDILSYLELHRTVSRKEEETYNLRVRLAKLKGEELPALPPGVVLTHKKRRADETLDPSAGTPLFPKQ